VVKNTRAFAEEIKRLGWRVVSGGTDSHLFLLNTASCGIGGKEASDVLESIGIIVNKNTIPFDERTPVDPSGIRIGTSALTTRGMKEREMKTIAGLVSMTFTKKISPSEARRRVKVLVKKFPIRV